MNPKKEFVKEIMSVLRLDQNIYTVGAIEEIIERIDTKDYTIFIAYLGERDSDFERPIQTIAKATEDFYEKKNKPKRLEISNDADNIVKVVIGANGILIDKKRREYLKKENKERFSTLEEQDKISSASNIEMVEFILRVKSIGHVDIKSIIPIIKSVGGLETLVSIFTEGKIDLNNYIREKLGISKYQQLSICEKIDRGAREDINPKMLGMIDQTIHGIAWG